MSYFICRFTLNNSPKVHFVPVDEQFTMQRLNEAVRVAQPSVTVNGMRYKDDEGDEILCTTDLGVQEAARMACAMPNSGVVAHLDITAHAARADTPDTEVVHVTVEKEDGDSFEVTASPDTPVTSFKKQIELLTGCPIDLQDLGRAPERCERAVVHPAICDHCDERIVGIRHKCETCDDYDLCSACLNKNLVLPFHSTLHGFREIHHPFNGFERMLVNQFQPISPDVVSPAMVMAENPVTPPKPTGTQHAAICDNCQATIFGIRYKCANCEDFDLCEACEELQPHDETHVFLKIRKPIRFGVRHVMPSLYDRKDGYKQKLDDLEAQLKMVHSELRAAKRAHVTDKAKRCKRKMKRCKRVEKTAPVAAPVAEPVAEPVPQLVPHVEEPIPEPIAEPIAEPVAEPTPEPTPEPVAEEPEMTEEEQIIMNMGFEDRALVRTLLIAYSNDIERVIGTLLQ